MAAKKSAKAASWTTVRTQLQGKPAGTVAVVPRRQGLKHPREAGARATSTWPTGQLADYIIDSVDGGAPLAIRQFDDRFEAFLDTSALATQVLAAIEKSPKSALFVGAALVGGAMGSSVSNKREGALLGAGLGLLLAALFDEASKDG